MVLPLALPAFLPLTLLGGALAADSEPPAHASQLVARRGLINDREWQDARHVKDCYPLKDVAAAGGDLAWVEVRLHYKERVDLVIGGLAEPISPEDRDRRLGELGVEPVPGRLFLYRKDVEDCPHAEELQPAQATTDPGLYLVQDGDTVQALMRVHPKTSSERSQWGREDDPPSWGRDRVRLLQPDQIGGLFSLDPYEGPADVWVSVMRLITLGSHDVPELQRRFLDLAERRAEVSEAARQRIIETQLESEAPILRRLARSEAALAEGGIADIIDRADELWAEVGPLDELQTPGLRERLEAHEATLRQRLEQALAEVDAAGAQVMGWYLRESMGLPVPSPEERARITAPLAAEETLDLDAPGAPAVHIGEFVGEATVSLEELGTEGLRRYTGYRDNSEAAAEWEARYAEVQAELESLSWVPRGTIGYTTYTSGERDFQGQLYDPGESAARAATEASKAEMERLKELQRRAEKLQEELHRLMIFKEHKRRFGHWTETVTVPVTCQAWRVLGHRTVSVEVDGRLEEFRHRVSLAIPAEEGGLCRHRAYPDLGLPARDDTITREEAIARAMAVAEASWPARAMVEREWTSRVRERRRATTGLPSSYSPLQLEATAWYVADGGWSSRPPHVTDPAGLGALMERRGEGTPGDGTRTRPLARTLPELVEEHMRSARRLQGSVGMANVYHWVCDSQLGHEAFPETCPQLDPHPSTELPHNWDTQPAPEVIRRPRDLVKLAACMNTAGGPRHAWLDGWCPAEAEDPMARWVQASEAGAP